MLGPSSPTIVSAVFVSGTEGKRRKDSGLTIRFDCTWSIASRELRARSFYWTVLFVEQSELLLLTRCLAGYELINVDHRPAEMLIFQHITNADISQDFQCPLLGILAM